MGDLLYVAVVAGFFALTLGYVVVCDRLIGPPIPRTWSTAARTRRRPGRPPRRWPGLMGADNVVGLVLAVLLAGYLVVALLFPEKL